MKLSEIFLGFNDGIVEAKQNADFSTYFYNHENLADKILDREKWLVLGRKGAGKSILGQYLVERVNNPDGFGDFSSYKDVHIHRLEDLKSDDVSPNQFISIWKWFFLIQLSKIILRSQELIHDENHGRLEKFFKDNFGEKPIDAQMILETTKGKKFSGVLKDIGIEVGGEHSTSTKSTPGDYLNYIDDLEETLFSLLQKSRMRYILVIDELDHRFQRTQLYQDLLVGVIYAANYLNEKFIEGKMNAGVVVLLRTDIARWLNDVDLNKILSDFSISIDWGREESLNSPLFDLILTKIRASSKSGELSSISRHHLLSMYFPVQHMSTPGFAEFFLSRTLLRPRDAVQYLKFVRDLSPSEISFTKNNLYNAEGRYSEYLWGEFRNELKGVLPDHEIELMNRLLTALGKKEFLWKDVTECHETRLKGDPNFDLHNAFRKLFEYSIVGNRYFDQKKSRTVHIWHYLNHTVGTADIDFDLTILVHRGLHKFLNLRS